ncbi:unnamed protein product [Spodoptera exigua]|nr:unnamed protein product [Spodoptera exigua]
MVLSDRIAHICHLPYFMGAAVVIAFFVCWVPFHVQRLFFIYGYNLPQFHVINEHLFNVAGALYYVSATVNPILYNVMSGRKLFDIMTSMDGCQTLPRDCKFRRELSTRVGVIGKACGLHHRDPEFETRRKHEVF